MKDDVISRLGSFGYEVTDSDEWTLGFVIQKVENSICNSCNINSIPDGLHQIAVDMVCGEFLQSKKAMGQLTDFDFETVVKQIQEGDTNITFAVGDASLSPEQRFDALISYLLTYGKGQSIRYRRLVW